MKLKWVILIGIVVLLLGLGALKAAGAIEVKWQGLAMGLSVLAAPFKYVFSLFQSNEEKIKEIRESHEKARAKEHQYQKELEQEVDKRQDRVKDLQEKVDNLNEEMERLKKKESELEEQVEKMSVRKKKEKIKEHFGEF